MGAAIAAGSQKWKGASADFETAPASTSSTATALSAVSGCEATIAETELVPASTCRRTSPTSIASPPNVVTSSA